MPLRGLGKHCRVERSLAQDGWGHRRVTNASAGTPRLWGRRPRGDQGARPEAPVLAGVVFPAPGIEGAGGVVNVASAVLKVRPAFEVVSL
jgi:hypothetical protein